MKGKLIKLGLSEGYRLDDLNGNYIASTLNGKNKLSLRNCEEIEFGFSLVELFDKVDSSIDYHEFDFCSFRLGVKAVLEILGDKKFDMNDIALAFRAGIEHGINPKKPNTTEYVQSLQQTEWDVEIKMVFNHIPKNNGIHNAHTIESVPKLDENGCLILKRK